MPRTAESSKGAKGTNGAGSEAGSTGDVYTMAEAARLKGVSYHTVSRAVRRGKLPAQRLGRMALIAAEDLRTWRPMRERAPRKYRRREPNPGATPALLDLASGERVELARRLSTLYEIIYGVAAEQPVPDFLGLLADRLAGVLDLKRVEIWGLDDGGKKATRLANFGAPLSAAPDKGSLSELPLLARLAQESAAVVIDDIADLDVKPRAESYQVTSLFVAPLRIGSRSARGLVVGDVGGANFSLSEAQLGLAQALASQAAVALELAK